MFCIIGEIIEFTIGANVATINGIIIYLFYKIIGG
jgi:hypothetical protein